jgi:hypothetical protein
LKDEGISKTDLYKPWGNNQFDVVGFTPYLHKIKLDDNSYLGTATIYNPTTPCKREGVNIEV